MTHGSHSRTGDYATTRIGWKVIVGVTIHDRMSNLRKRGVDDGQLIHGVITRFEMICSQYSINEPEKGGTVEFEFWQAYKS